MSGPCLCGDPHCSACGGAYPWQEAAEEAIINALDVQTEEEAAFLLALLPHLLASHRQARAAAIAEAERERQAQQAEEAAMCGADSWDFAYPAGASAEEITGGVMADRQCRGLLEGAEERWGKKGGAE